MQEEIEGKYVFSHPFPNSPVYFFTLICFLHNIMCSVRMKSELSITRELICHDIESEHGVTR